MIMETIIIFGMKRVLYFLVVLRHYSQVEDDECPLSRLPEDVLGKIANYHIYNSTSLKQCYLYGLLPIIKLYKKIDYDWGLIISSINGRINVMQYCLDCGATPAFKNSWAFRVAAENRQISAMKLLMDNGAGGGDETISYAIHNQHLDVVKFLIDHKIYPDAKLLEYAVWGNDYDIVKYIVEKVPNVISMVLDRDVQYGCGGMITYPTLHYISQWDDILTGLINRGMSKFYIDLATGRNDESSSEDDDIGLELFD